MTLTEIGLGFQSDKHAADYARLAGKAEAYGFDVLSVFGDLMYQPPIFPLLEMARATERVRIGAACWNPYSMHPYEIAGQVAALDLASAGRAYVGLARGSWLGDVGIAQPRPLAHLRDAAQLIQTLLSGSPDGFQGEVFQLAPGSRLAYQPHRPRVPLLIGTWGAQTAAMAGRIGAREIKIGGTVNPAMVEVMRHRLAGGGATGPAGAPGIVVGAVTVVDEDGRLARSRARTEVAMYLPVVAALDPTVDVPEDLLARVKDLLGQGRAADAGALIPDDLLDLFAFCGTPEHVAAQAQRLIDAGVSRVEFGTPHGLTDDLGVDLIGTRVLPLLQKTTTAPEDAAAR
ncbi:LLM class flavin-dependent oxidoreductase [Streptomyces sp. NPDC005492]|uniref:LLM class flavin-dependent oxidoreductase n=1 Tax=Streptomyces sp. NPDC005492 TaxID=3156883 RepID=UPI0033BC6944